MLVRVYDERSLVAVSKGDVTSRMTLGKRPDRSPRSQSEAEARLRRERGVSAGLGAATAAAGVAAPKVAHKVGMGAVKRIPGTAGDTLRTVVREQGLNRSPKLLSRVTGGSALKAALPAALLGANALHAHKELNQLRAKGDPVRQHKLSEQRRVRNNRVRATAGVAGVTAGAALTLKSPVARKWKAGSVALGAASTAHGVKQSLADQKKLKDMRRS